MVEEDVAEAVVLPPSASAFRSVPLMAGELLLLMSAVGAEAISGAMLSPAKTARKVV